LEGRFLLAGVLSGGAILIVMIAFNYAVDFEDDVLDNQRGFPKFLWYFLFYAIPYYSTIAIAFRGSQTNIWTSTFIAKSVLGLAVLSLDSSLPFMQRLLLHADREVYVWSYKVIVNTICVVTVLLPLFIYYRKFENDQEGFYGLTPKKFDSSPYFTMLLIMLPILVAATWLPGFLKQYPMYKTTAAHQYLGVPEYVTALTYEAAYGFDFVSVELLFRGFMVIGMTSLLGRKSVLAMVVIYCMLHFGKPAGEAISSIFGGYILGVIAYETRSIWGGIIVHVGIAWMMEAISFLAKM
jgi:hypothetical protein